MEEGNMNNIVSEKTAKIAYGAMGKVIAGYEITEEEQEAIDSMKAFRKEYKRLKEEYGKANKNN